MPLVLELRESTSIPLEVDSIRLEAVRSQSPDDVLRLPVQHGNQQIPLGDFFNASGSAAGDETLVWQGDCSKVKHIAQGLSTGRVLVEGHAGMHCGAHMTGGEVTVRGNAADWLGAEMAGGTIHVHGNAGHLVGAVYRGGRRGMTGGTILVEGDAGNEIGHTMRRGVIAVRGRSGDLPAFNIIAGSLLLFGEPGIRPAAGARRGSVVFFHHSPPEPLPTFRYSGTFQPTFLRFYLRQLQARGFEVPQHLLDTTFHRYAGDFLEAGKAELLLPTSAS